MADEPTLDATMVLVLDEHGQMHATHRRVLSSFGFEPVVARTTEAALMLASEGLPAVVIVDLVADDVRGVELAVELRAHYRDACPPLVLVADPNVPISAPRQLLFDAIFTKPYLVERIAAGVQRLAREHCERKVPSGVEVKLGIRLPGHASDDRG